MVDIVERLRERLTTAPKPGTEPFMPFPGWTYYLNVGGSQPKAGDDAGCQLATVFEEADGRQVQEMVYAPEPLCFEAASEIVRLRRALEEARATILALMATADLGSLHVHGCPARRLTSRRIRRRTCTCGLHAPN